MRSNMTFEDVQKELETQVKADHIIQPQKVKAVLTGEGIKININDQMEYGISSFGHRMLAGETNIPTYYYDRKLVSCPELLVADINHWLQKSERKRFMIRTLNNKVRAIGLSDSFRRLDSINLLNLLMPVIQDEDEQWNISSSCLNSQNGMSLQITSPKLSKEVQKGDIIRFGFEISNSEVGLQSYGINPFNERLVCTNGMTIAEFSGITYKRIHRTSPAYNVIIDEKTGLLQPPMFNQKEVLNILQNEGKAIIESVAVLTDRSTTDRIIDIFKTTMIRQIEGWSADPSNENSVFNIKNQFKINEKEAELVLTHLPEDGMTQWGLLNAFTRSAQDSKTYESGKNLEEIGGRIALWNHSNWSNFNKRMAMPSNIE